MFSIEMKCLTLYESSNTPINSNMKNTGWRGSFWIREDSQRSTQPNVNVEQHDAGRSRRGNGHEQHDVYVARDAAAGRKKMSSPLSAPHYLVPRI